MLCARRTTHDSESDDRRRRGRESETGWQSSDKYDGAWPARHRKTRTAILNSTRCRTDSQCIKSQSNLRAHTKYKLCISLVFQKLQHYRETDRQAHDPKAYSAAFAWRVVIQTLLYTYRSLRESRRSCQSLCCSQQSESQVRY